MVKLGDVCHNISSGRNKIKKKSGKYPVYGSTGVIGFSDEYNHEGEILLAARVGANAGLIQRVAGKYDVSDNTLMIEAQKIVNLDYLYHLLISLNLNQYATGGGQPLITGKLLKSLEIKLPSISEQKSIVSILDKFDALVNDISIGLPAEINARRKQYEYYRNQLLTFPELTK